MRIISSSVKLNASKKKVEKYLDMLATGEKKYTFDTHEGFKFLEGNIRKEGSKFYTREKFLGIKITLNFFMTKVKKNSFKFRLTKPFSNYSVFCEFLIDKGRLVLDISTETEGTKLFFIRFFRPLYVWIIKKQITKEVEFIKKEVESM